LTSREQIELTCDSLRDFLLEKNKRYGDSVLNPVHVFSKLDAEAGARVRIDDKISRINNSEELRKNDVCDLIGYLILLCVNNGFTNFEDLLD
jgi:hypothetical protein